MRLLVTGATGRLGSYLVPRLLESGHEVIALVRRNSIPPTGTIPLEGDVSARLFGLQDIPKVDAVVHMAALTSFDQGKTDQLRRINVEGTRNAKDVARAANARMVHISTAYVCGDHEGFFGPDDLDVGQHYRNDYELTKFEAETLLLTAAMDIPLTILRPSVIIGESKVIGLPPVGAFYGAIMLFDRIRRSIEETLGLPPLKATIRLRSNPHGTLNIIPGDIAAAQMADIINAGALGTFHITNPLPPTISYLCLAIGDAINAEIVPLLDFEPNPAERILHRGLQRKVLPYLRGEAVFDVRSTAKVSRTMVPPISHDFLVASIRAYLKAHVGEQNGAEI